jgi:hypothetical protein
VAVIVAAIYHSDPNHAADKLTIGFFDKNEWAKFVSLWTKARRAKRPTEAQVYSNANGVGSYFDAADETELTVSVGTEGDIDFALAGKPDANKSPTVLSLFELVPRDFSAFDRNVRTVSAYFAK